MNPTLHAWIRVALLGICYTQALLASETSSPLSAAVSRLEDDFLVKVEGTSDLEPIFDAYEAELQRLITANPGQPEPLLGMTELFEKCEPARTIRMLDQSLARGDLPEKVRAGFKSLRTTAGLVGSPINVSLTTIDGQSVRFEDYKGKVVVIDFWATWCGPCVRDLPKLHALYRKHADDGLVVIGVSFDRERSKLEAFIKQKQYPWPQIYPTTEERERIAQTLGVSGGYLPTVFIIGRDGRLRHTLNSRFRFEEKVAALLSEKTK